LANAIKFTNRGTVTVRVSRMEGTADKVLVRFEVIDTGIGIPIAAHKRLFQPFVQAEGSTHRRYGGTGLGLVIAARLTEQMGGEMRFESDAGTGSNFHFTARLEGAREIERAVARRCDPVADAQHQWRKHVRVLLVGRQSGESNRWRKATRGAGLHGRTR
jgi:K+-sensing histidine kinase KdpD